jgi:hypothetical protein
MGTWVAEDTHIPSPAINGGQPTSISCFCFTPCLSPQKTCARGAMQSWICSCCLPPPKDARVRRRGHRPNSPRPPAVRSTSAGARHQRSDSEPTTVPPRSRWVAVVVLLTTWAWGESVRFSEQELSCSTSMCMPRRRCRCPSRRRRPRVSGAVSHAVPRIGVILCFMVSSKATITTVHGAAIRRTDGDEDEDQDALGHKPWTI